MSFWEDTLRYLYLPRLLSRGVLQEAIRKGAATHDFFGTAYSQNGDKFEGFKLGDSDVQLDDTLLLIEPKAAKQYADSLRQPYSEPEVILPIDPGDGGTTLPPVVLSPVEPPVTPPAVAKARFFHGTAVVTAATAKTRLVELAEEIIQVLTSDANGTVKVTVEIEAEFPNGVTDHVKRAVSENAGQLGLKSAEWE